MHRWRVPGALGLMLLALLTCNGCRFGQGQPTRYYVLTPMAPLSATASAMHLRDVAIGVGPVQLPQYANRPQIVTGNTRHELSQAPFEEWAEPLRDNFIRVLAENLSVLLATDRVAVFPWKGPMPIAYQVIVEVTHFLGETGGETSLVALWSIVGNHGRKVLVSQRSSFREPTGQQGYEDLAAAMSRTVAALSRDIAAAITTLASQKPHSRLCPHGSWGSAYRRVYRQGRTERFRSHILGGSGYGRRPRYGWNPCGHGRQL